MTKIFLNNYVHRTTDDCLIALPKGTLAQFRFDCGTSALHALISLATCADENGIVDVTVSELAELTGYSDSTMSTAIDELEKAGHIEVLEWTYYARREMSETVRWQVFKRDGYRCDYCGKDNGPFEVDHVKPVSEGGRDTIDNLVTACPDCNRKKANKSVEKFNAKN